ncbi:MAG: gluconate 2-dehydrogenase subunit 3 family protein [Luteitalea sp.]|nr:gluconate 2-dehydrogenase subunit 3 family protein [Luteitalea sp.]
MSDISRRKALQVLGSVPAVAGLGWTGAEAAQVHQHAEQARQAAAAEGTAYTPKFFTKHEYETLRLLADLIIPADERSGSASDAGVPEFVDFMMIDQPARQTAMRGGLRWLDRECGERFGKRFVDCTTTERSAILDDVAWPKKAEEKSLTHGGRFFTLVRDLTATGFWSSKMGIEDIGYVGNVPVGAWTGCPDEVLEKLGVSYEGLEKWYETGSEAGN